ncbi:GNAT family N-acetyltransferase [Nocardioides sp. YIM 152315]|uniref:GNAT family N-acetyltransferase n=1 Tax=Nocardioides sp. YIM 152315 TaxID=3031760 RepID=UPI0023DC4D07|nr:GNAT family N-acetyltransferase [Nocardioides sp. YIM 152315]MDF1606316.1 GNAT family N-acetyltransferase [Nocardioides sp. YIM 152315]
MHVRSLAFRTDLALLRLAGSEVEDHGSYVAVRTPDNPTYYWGNFLLLPHAPTTEELPEWVDRFGATYPRSRHLAFGVDGGSGGRDDLEPFRVAGLEVDASSVMTATSVHEPPHPHREATCRPLAGDDDWHQQLELSIAGEHEVSGRDFVVAKTASERALSARGVGAWWGAFVGDRLLASMGLFAASPGLARFQQVKTHPDARGRGLAGTLVHRVSRYGFDELGARELVMVADPDYLAIRIYRSVGFDETETQLQAQRTPPA